MATLYWYGGTGNWSDYTNHWSYNSGNIPANPATSAPTLNDDVVFDANSGGGTCTISATAYCRDFSASSYAGTIAGSSTVNIYGNLTLCAGMQWTLSDTINMKATSTGHTITLAGVNIFSSGSLQIIFNGIGGGWTLQDNWNISVSTGYISLQAGTLDTNGMNITISSFVIEGSSAKTLILRNSVIRCQYWHAENASNLTLDAGTSLIDLSLSTSPFFGGNGGNYYDLKIPFGDILGSNYFHDLTCNYTGTSPLVAFKLAGNQTVTNLCTLNSSASRRLLVCSNALKTARSITANSFIANYIDFRDIVCAGNGAPCTGTLLVDGGGNSGIVFSPPVTRYWIGGTGSYEDTNHWSETSGGTGGASVPTIQDTAIFDQNSFSAAGQKVTMFSDRTGNTIWTNATHSPTFYIQNNLYSYGSQIYTDTMTLSPSGSILSFVNASPCEYRPANTNNCPNYTYFNRETVTLTAPYDVSGGSLGYIYVNGKADFNDQNVTYRNLFSVGNNATLWMGNGTITCTGVYIGATFYVNASATIYAEGSTIKFTDSSNSNLTFSGGGKVYNNIWFARGASTGSNIITGTNTFNEFKDTGSAAHTITFPNATTTVNAFNVNGNPNNLITLSRTGTSGKFTLSKSSGIVSCDYLSISNSTVTGGATWYAGTHSINGGNNTGWIFNSPPTTVLITKDLAYVIKSSITEVIQKTIGYFVRAPTVNTKDLVYTIQKNINIGKNLAYSVTTIASISISLSYAIRLNNSSVLELQYAVKLNNLSSKSLQYEIKQEIFLSKQLAYYIRILPYASKTLPYTRKIIYSAKKSPYNSLKRVI